MGLKLLVGAMVLGKAWSWRTCGSLKELGEAVVKVRSDGRGVLFGVDVDCCGGGIGSLAGGGRSFGRDTRVHGS